MIDLGKKITEYSQSDVYPFHMPGHKRRFDAGFQPYIIDITEVEPFDDLHHPEGILKELQEECAAFFGAQKSFYLVNGSTCGILSAIIAVMNTGDYYLLMDRGSHRSAYNAVVLGGYEPEFVRPADSKYGFYDGIYPQDVDTLLKKRHENCGVSKKKTLKPCLYVTSPTYDGITSDIKALAELIHERDGILIVDSAHGAHFGMHEIFPDSAVSLGADIVIMSLHKTLPSPTQTSVLHIVSDRAAAPGVERFLSMFESSSPSYILMSGISSCMGFLSSEGRQLFDRFADRLKLFYDRAKNLKYLRVYRDEYDTKKRDISKILIGTGKSGLSGHELYRILMDRYHLALEMEASFYVTALSSVMDTDEGFERLINALEEIDRSCIPDKDSVRGGCVKSAGADMDRNMISVFPEPSVVMPEALAFRAEKREVLLDDAKDRISGTFVYFYPPGIPLLAPGELVTDEIIGLIRSYLDRGFKVRGLKESDRVEVCIID